MAYSNKSLVVTFCDCSESSMEKEWKSSTYHCNIKN